MSILGRHRLRVRRRLTSFTGYRRIHLHTLHTHTWAPVFWDRSRGQYGIVYSANNGQDVFLENYTSDFRTVSTPQVYFSPGFPVLDGDSVVDGNTTYLYYKNLANGNLYGARSTTGAPNSFTTCTSALRQGNASEAPLLVKRNDGGAYPFDPYQDQMWLARPGLADSSGCRSSR